MHSDREDTEQRGRGRGRRVYRAAASLLELLSVSMLRDSGTPSFTSAFCTMILMDGRDVSLVAARLPHSAAMTETTQL